MLSWFRIIGVGMNNNIEKMRSTLIFKWFSNLRLGNSTENILVLEEVFHNIKYTIEELLKEYNYDNTK